MGVPSMEFYADFHGLAALRDHARTQQPGALQAAAQQFESLFTQMLLKNMREAGKGFGGDLFGSDQSDFYQGMFDEQIALQLSRGKGLGLADMLIRQLSGGASAPPDAAPKEPSSKAGTGPAATDGAGSLRFSTPAPAGAAKAAQLRAHGGMSGDKAEFIRSLWPHARQAGRELGVDPHALLAQAALETGWGRFVPCGAGGQCSFNLFGIKAGGQWRGEQVAVPTLEFEAGAAVRRVESFRAYASPAESFRDYTQLLRDNPRYRQALDAGGDVAAFAQALQRGGYATDPDYASKLVAVAADVRTSVNAFKTADAGPINLYGRFGT